MTTTQPTGGDVTTTDELRAADLRERAERIIRKGDDSCYWDADGIIDAERVARGLLARLPAADDGAAVTTERLLALGFEFRGDGSMIGIDLGYDSATLLTDGRHWWLSSNDGDEIAVSPPATMGAARALLSGLGIGEGA